MWDIKDNKLEKTFVFADFDACIDFVLQIQKIANEMNHHPDVSLHSYRYVTISLTTHDLSAITDRDHSFAQKVDQLF